MSTPCDKGPIIDTLADVLGRVGDQLDAHGNKLDKIHDSLTILAVQKDRLDRIGKEVDDHEVRLRHIEATPNRLLWWVLGIAAAVLSGALLHSLLTP